MTAERSCCVCSPTAPLTARRSRDATRGARRSSSSIHAGPRAARDRDRALGDAPFVTIVHPDDHRRPHRSPMRSPTVGVRRRAASAGSARIESVSVRGAAPGHTAVLIDGVPLARIAAVTTDLGRFALDAFGEVDLYRGAVPVELGGAGVGGAVNLIDAARPRRARRARAASIGAGSFGARHLRAALRRRSRRRCYPRRRSATRARPATTRYFDDNGTPLNRDDDSFECATTTASISSTARRGGGIAIAARPAACALAWKHQGLPGTMAQPALAASLSTLDVIGDARVDAHSAGDRAPARVRARRAPAPARSARRARARRRGPHVPDAAGRRVDDVGVAARRASR